MFRRGRTPWQIWPILIIWIGVLPLIVGETIASSANYAEVFFFADAGVAQEIIKTGHIRQPVVDLTYWNKMGARTRQPILPVYMAIGSIITDYPLFIFQRQLPLYPVLIGCYYLVMREFAGKKVSGFLAVVGAVGPNFTAVTAYVTGPMFLIPFLLCVWILIRRAKGTQYGALLNSLIIPLLLVNLVYSYPRLFALASIVAILTILIHSRLGGELMVSPLAGVFAGIWVIFAYGFVAYQNAISGIVYNIILDPASVVSVATGGGGPVAPLSIPPVSLITIPILVPLGLVGGVVVIRRLGNYQRSKTPTQCGETVLFAWGVGLILFAILHILVGKFWLVIRIYGTAIPLILVSSAVAISYLYNNYRVDLSENINFRTQALGSLAVVAVVVILLVSFSWSATAANTDIHTYTQEDMNAAEWAAYADAPVASDMSLGSHITLHQRAVYPRTSEEVEQLFYSDPPTQWSSAFASDVRLFMISKEWIDSGLYVPPSARQPVTDRWFNSTRQSGSVVYSSGSVSAVYNNSS
ncbi:hypothetical protein [Haloferax volcanii]|uniref:hypothetical protein n=1 Tax=Haloferax volcanii TaxID=2246 RepID=UPI003D30344E